MVADYLKKNNVTIRKIKPIKPLPKNMFFRIIVGGYLAGKDYQDELVDFDSDISQYKKIIIGSPIWRDRLSTPINTVLSKLDLRDKELIFILYSGSGYAAKATEKINKLYPKAKIIHLKEPLKYQEVLVDKLKNI